MRKHVLREAETLGQVFADFVAVEDLDLAATLTELGLEHAAEGRLTRAGQAGEPEAETFLVAHCRMIGSGGSEGVT